MSRRLLPLLCLLALASLTTSAFAQDDADALLSDVAATAEALEDAAFLLVGHLVDPDGTRIALEMELQVIPGERVASAYVVQPDALADNIIVLDGDTVYNYTFLTHQVTVFDADDPDALGGLLGGGEGDVEFSFDLQKLFEGYQAEVIGSAETPVGPATVVRLTNLEENATIQRVDAAIAEATTLPYRLELFEADGELLAELVVQDLRTDVGLSPADVTFLPEDAEVIDERSSADGN